MNFRTFLMEWETEKHFSTLKSVVKAQTQDLINYLNKISTKVGKSAIKTYGKEKISGPMSWLIIPKGSDNKICLVAHIDRVFENLQQKKILKIGHGEKSKWFSPSGIGGDDRCGVYALIHIYRTLPEAHRPFLLFTHYEETGMFGAEQAVKDFGDELKDVKFFIELDRQGKDEMVFYNEWSKDEEDHEDFQTHVGRYGFKKERGFSSDIRILGRHFKKASVNLSVGYMNQHKKDEYVIVKHLMDTIKKVKHICVANEPLPDKPPVEKKTYKEYDWGLGGWEPEGYYSKGANVKKGDVKKLGKTNKPSNKTDDNYPDTPYWQNLNPKKYKSGTTLTHVSDEPGEEYEFETYKDELNRKREELRKKREEKEKEEKEAKKKEKKSFFQKMFPKGIKDKEKK